MSEYAAIPSTGKLKLKGVKDSRVEKKKKKKARIEDNQKHDGAEDNSVVLKHLEDEDLQIRKEDRRRMGVVDGQKVEPGAGAENEDVREHLKTDAEKRHDEQRRKRLEERLKKEGVKTHKQRVEELNKYLSNLSEHHDMPKIGPGFAALQMFRSGYRRSRQAFDVISRCLQSNCTEYNDSARCSK